MAAAGVMVTCNEPTETDEFNITDGILAIVEPHPLVPE
jgi:hypothetical protein